MSFNNKYGYILRQNVKYEFIFKGKIEDFKESLDCFQIIFSYFFNFFFNFGYNFVCLGFQGK